MTLTKRIAVSAAGALILLLVFSPSNLDLQASKIIGGACSQSIGYSNTSCPRGCESGNYNEVSFEIGQGFWSPTVTGPACGGGGMGQECNRSTMASVIDPACGPPD